MFVRATVQANWHTQESLWSFHCLCIWSQIKWTEARCFTPLLYSARSRVDVVWFGLPLGVRYPPLTGNLMIGTLLQLPLPSILLKSLTKKGCGEKAFHLCWFCKEKGNWSWPSPEQTMGLWEQIPGCMHTSQTINEKYIDIQITYSNFKCCFYWVTIVHSGYDNIIFSVKVMNWTASFSFCSEFFSCFFISIKANGNIYKKM